MKKRLWNSKKTPFYKLSLMFDHWKVQFFCELKKNISFCFSRLTYLFSWFLPQPAVILTPGKKKSAAHTFSFEKKKNFMALFMDRVQLPQG